MDSRLSPNIPAQIAQLRPKLEQRARRFGPDSEDLVQETMLRLCAHLSEDRDIRDLEAYAMTTLRNLTRSRWRRQVETEELEDHMSITETDASDLLAIKETLAAIDALSENHASLLRLVRDGIESPQEIAMLTGLPLGTVNSRLARARARLRDLTDA
ncbi:RNA polymerase sigma factor [Shimia aestuarii]|uniref:RNA polymerase sigma-70 factor, ECF subfamily n=1 Tax=Shimia aestuarii TaxID=254406 RepID=A0A1I4PB26_9RHOB|nr:RNA polymerase sigma factor [Shimia aestuarii]SFM24776.1 RNA polymerase sigma-70 factor, ECF subfamily [Shimia aestuarii]